MKKTLNSWLIMRDATGTPVGLRPTNRMVRPCRKDKVISAGSIADDRIAGCA